ncbi:MAG: F0F1 ATP synthase subunit B family protein [Marivita sp.]|uniref:F0F1 ATP synthase subunit B family protein n=1 Tax=Marivita sp. TaxID=2003365 RepID=UPI003EF548EF
MTIDFWGLGLQAVNVLILVWLLSRVFWRPVAAAIAKRQKTAQAVIGSAQATQAKADNALTEATKARAGIAEERAAMRDAARAEAESAAKSTLAEARAQAEAILATAKDTISHDRVAAAKANDVQASELSLKIAARLLERLNGPTVQSAFLSQLVESIADMPAADRKALTSDPKGIEIVSATDTGAEQRKIEKAIQTALGGTTELRFTTDTKLIAGLELRSPHFTLHNSWHADLAEVRKAVKNAA